MEKLTWYVIQLPQQEGKIQKVVVGGKRLCLLLLRGKLYATGSRCPHAGADLSQGWCEEGKLVCPYHRHRFDLQTGKGDVGQGNYIDVFPVREENGKWYVGFRKPWWKKIF
ncbi:Rieske (2Fe-2S) protein [Sphingobacterium wenxiniae]|nr:Rieske 2Fe-2S domain-containing protein [Sphingobacterium wenxiniae]